MKAMRASEIRGNWATLLSAWNDDDSLEGWIDENGTEVTNTYDDDGRLTARDIDRADQTVISGMEDTQLMPACRQAIKNRHPVRSGGGMTPAQMHGHSRQRLAACPGDVHGQRAGGHGLGTHPDHKKNRRQRKDENFFLQIPATAAAVMAHGVSGSGHGFFSSAVEMNAPG